MSDVRAISGVQYKLTSPTGTLLGTVTIPKRWGTHLQECQPVFFRIGRILSPTFDIKAGYIVLSHAMRGAVELHGCSIEEFEQIDGCSFSPSAAYLRSVLE